MIDDDAYFLNPLAVDVPRLLSSLGIRADHVGDRWIATCPSGNHADRTPSWDIKDQPGHERHGLHRCFACSFGGTSTFLVEHVVGITPMGAREWIRERAMGEPPIVQNVAVNVAPSSSQFRLPAETILAPLGEWPSTPAAYLANRRITASQVARWGLGYAVEGRLAGRIVVPARDRHGTPLHYTARTFVQSPKRYLEPKRQECPVDGAIFGEQHWPETDRDLVVVTEGAFNALAVERVANIAVASLFGSTIKLLHLQKISTFRAALVLTDPDLAGERAAEKILTALRRHVRMARVELSPGEDADSIAPAELRAALVQAWRTLGAA